MITFPSARRIDDEPASLAAPATAPSDAATPRQLSYLAALVRDRECDRLGPVPEHATKRQLSDAIAWALRQPRRTAPQTTTPQTTAPHTALTRPDRNPAAPQPPRREVPDGVYTFAYVDPRTRRDYGTEIIRVRTGQQSRRQYASLFDSARSRPAEHNPVTGSTVPGRVTWSKAPGLFTAMTDPANPAPVPLDAASAADFGALYALCVRCGRLLSDDGENRSLAVGYGPRCAEIMGWPWG